jgi:hypothetical protein
LNWSFFADLMYVGLDFNQKKGGWSFVIGFCG